MVSLRKIRSTLKTGASATDIATMMMVSLLSSWLAAETQLVSLGFHLAQYYRDKRQKKTNTTAITYIQSNHPNQLSSSQTVSIEVKSSHVHKISKFFRNSSSLTPKDWTKTNGKFMTLRTLEIKSSCSKQWPKACFPIVVSLQRISAQCQIFNSLNLAKFSRNLTPVIVEAQIQDFQVWKLSQLRRNFARQVRTT